MKIKKILRNIFKIFIYLYACLAITHIFLDLSSENVSFMDLYENLHIGAHKAKFDIVFDHVILWSKISLGIYLFFLFCFVFIFLTYLFNRNKTDDSFVIWFKTNVKTINRSFKIMLIISWLTAIGIAAYPLKVQNDFFLDDIKELRR